METFVKATLLLPTEIFSNTDPDESRDSLKYVGISRYRCMRV